MPESADKLESARRNEERLDSWKEIASYLNRDVTTAQRWEKREGMPVHRHVHDRIGSVYAFRTELDAWARSRNPEAPPFENKDATPVPAAAPPRARSRPKWLILPLSAGIALAFGIILWLQSADYFWSSPLAGARFQVVTDWDGAAQAAALSRDGQFIAFLSDRDGQMDVWITQVGSGEFHNLTRGSAPELVNPSIRLLGVLAGWLSRDILGSQTGRVEPSEYRHLGGANAGRPAEAILGRRRRVGLGAGQLARGVPHHGFRRSAVRFKPDQIAGG